MSAFRPNFASNNHNGSNPTTRYSNRPPHRQYNSHPNHNINHGGNNVSNNVGNNANNYNSNDVGNNGNVIGGNVGGGGNVIGGNVGGDGNVIGGEVGGGSIGGEIPVLTLGNSLSQISFCDRECYNINNDKTKEAIINYVQNKHKINIIDRQYVTLDPNKIRNISHHEHLVATYSNGNPYLLLLTRIDETPCSIFIDRKCRPGYNYPKMHCVQYKFDKQLFIQDTLFTGELIRDVNREWQFLISDLLVHEDKSTRNNNVLSRFAIINNILDKHYISDPSQEICPIYCKKLFQYRHLTALFDNFMPSLSYICKGLVFYTLNNQFSNYCWIMPRDHQIQVKLKHEYPLPTISPASTIHSHHSPISSISVNSGGNNNNGSGNSSKEGNEGVCGGEMYESGNVKYGKNVISVMPEPRYIKVANMQESIDVRGVSTMASLGDSKTRASNKELPRFRIIKTGTPDIYNLYMGNVDRPLADHGDGEAETMNDERVCVAFIPDLATSKWLYDHFRNSQDRALTTVVECKYHSEFDKWVPVAICPPNILSHNMGDIMPELAAVARSGMSTSMEDVKKIKSNTDLAFALFI